MEYECYLDGMDDAALQIALQMRSIVLITGGELALDSTAFKHSVFMRATEGSDAAKVAG
jgi:hypothetical protein